MRRITGGSVIEVEFEGFRIEADLHRGQKTGLFLDQRLNRRRAEARARPARARPVLLPGRVGLARRARRRALGAGGGLLGARASAWW